MISRKKLLCYCGNDDNAIKILRQKQLDDFLKLLFVCFIEVILFITDVMIDGKMFFFIFGGGSYALYNLLFFQIFTPFSNDEENYINCILFDNAIVKDYSIEKFDYPYIKNDENQIIRLITESLPNELNCFRYVRCRKYWQLNGNRIEKIYKAVCCIENEWGK